MVQSSGLKNVFNRFKRGSAVKTPVTKFGSPSKPDATAGPSPAKRLFAFSPAKAPSSSRREIRERDAASGDLIPAAHSAMAVGSSLDSAGDDSNIKVVVRVRPRNDREANMGGAICVQPQDGNSLRLVAPAEPHSFAFDHVANETASQEDIFNVAGRPIVENSLRGFNSCLFAYGQTGSGKTYSMLGGEQISGEAAVAGDERRGLIQRIFEQIFEAAENQAASGVHTKITCSFLEIYNETISDLLSPGAAAGLPLREDSRRNGGVFVEGLSEETVSQVDDVAFLLERGVANRRVGETLMNERSSRSHSVFTATVERRTPGVNGSPDTVLRSRLHLVDLAGSERQKSTGAAGDRLKEASGINKSLSTLGLVIMSLVDQQQGRQRHIPYRDSKLTTLLRDSLGGNAKTVMVACISPAAINSAETLSTLRFADGAKRIKNKAVVNEDAEGDAESLRREVRRLKEELAIITRNGGAISARNKNGEETFPVTPLRGMSAAAGEGGLGLAPMTTGGAVAGGEGVRRALVGALRREEAAAVQVSTLQEELEGMRALVAARDADLQRTQMMLKLKESRLARATPSNDEIITTLNSEIELLKTKLDSHPEVKRFAVENLHLSHEVARLQSALDRQELAALGADVASLRREILGLTETTEAAEEECARARAEAEAAKAALESESHALKEAQAKLKEQEADSTLQQRVADLELENDELRLDAVNTKALKEEAERLCTHASGLEVECEGLKAALDSKTKEAAENEAVYKGSVEELATAWEELEKLEAANKALESAVAAAAEAAAARHEEHEAALSHASASLEESLRNISALERDLKASKAEGEELRAAVADVTKERDGLVDDVKTKQQELEEASIKLSELNSDLENQRSKLQEVEAVAKELKNNLVLTTSRAEKSEAAFAQAEDQIKEISAVLEHTKNELKETETKLAASIAEVTALQEAAVKNAAELSSRQSALEIATAECGKLREEIKTSNKRHEEETERLQEELRVVEGTKDELEYLLSDKSASLSEATEQLTSLRATLTKTKAAGEAAATKAAGLAAELHAARDAQEVADQEREVLEKKVVLLEQEVKEAQAEASALRCGPLEKEQQLILARAQLADAKALYEKTKLELASLSAGMRKKDEEVARVRAEMAMEVNDAAHQVQELLAAQERAEAAERRAAELARRIVMEATSGPQIEEAANGTSSWRDSVGPEQRRAVVQHLLRSFQSKPTYVPSDQEKLIRLVTRIEERLWMASNSREEYGDPNTMNMRIRQLLQANNGQAQTQAQAPNGGVPQPQAQPEVHNQQPVQIQQQQQPPQQLQQQYVGYMPTQGAPPMAGNLIVKQEQPELYPNAAGTAAPQQPQFQYQPVAGYGAPGGVPQAQMQGQPGALMPTAQAGYDPMALLNGGGAVAGGVAGAIGGAPVPGAVAGAPAGMSTAESGVRNMSYMTNGAPVLVRGGGGGLGSGLTGIPGMGAGTTMPIIKLEGGGLNTAAANAVGGGMIPINGGGGAGGLPQQLTQQPQHMQPGMMMPINNTGGALVTGGMGPSTSGMMPAPGMDPPVRVSGSLDDLLGEMPSELGADLGADGTVISPTAKNESRKQQILKQQRWLLFLRHCARCTLNDTECPYGGNCGVAKQLWDHLIQCKSETCAYPRCSPSRALLKHHQRCKSPQCPVCAPVKQYVAKQREAILRKKLDASGFSTEQQARYVEQVRARRAAQLATTSAAANSGAGPSSSSAWGGGAPIVDPQAVKRPRIMLQENMKTSLIEFFNAMDIRKHIQLVHLDGQNDTSAARRPTMMSSYDDFRTGFQEEESCCKVCHRNKMTFEPPTLYCDCCGQRIKRNQTYYATPKHSEIRGMYCHPCMQGTPGDTMQLQSFSMRKVDMEKKRNDDEQEEAWVQCDNCEGWVHQICGLFNKGRNNEERGFLCPPCLLNGLESGHRSVPAERPQAMLTAKDLPRCQLSDYLEARLQKTSMAERVARAKATGRPVEEIKGADGLVVRVVNNVTKKMEVKHNFCQAFAGVGSAYPDAASYKQKVVLLFQHQDGVDMCLFCLYVQEYGDDCAPPNNRVVHVSYLDSVKYFQPEKVSAAGMGVALRTMVYHDVLLGYIQYAKSLGYCSVFIWACPPVAGDDYILYCHPGKQKMPRSDRLREWYLTMLRRGRGEGIVAYISNLYDTYFEGGKDHRIDRPTILELPYLDGDYWPGEAENLLADLNNGNGGFEGNKAVKGRKGGKDKRWKPSHPDATLAEQVLGRLGETIQGMKEDFIVAHLYENCSHCRKYIDDDLRYYHPNPPQKVIIKSERTFDGIALDRPGGDSSRTVTLTRFQLCSECYTRESGQDPTGLKPLGLPSGIALHDLIAEPCPKIPPTQETVPQIDNEFFDTRHQFLSLCQGNHYQFDTCRRARHSSMMVLYHLHNPSEPAFTANCSVCNIELKPGEGYRCTTCTDFDMCAACHASPAVTHPHPLVAQATRKFDETRMRLTDEDRVKRDESLQRTMALLVHASDCRNPTCRSSNCAKVKALFNHAVNCNVKITGGCTFCRRMWALLQAHSKMCIAAECPVPRCRELRALRRQQASRQEDQRRAAYRQMLMQQQASVGAEGS